MNIFKVVSIGSAIIGALVGLEAGAPSAPIRVGNDWIVVQKVPAPK